MDKEERRKVFSSAEYEFVSAAANSEFEIVKRMITEGIDVSVQEKIYGRTALHSAAKIGSKKLVKFLIEHGAALNVVDYNDMTPLMIACHTGKKKGSEAADLLIDAGADVTYSRSADRMNAVKFALWGQCSREVIEKMIKKGANYPEAGFKILNIK